LVVVGGGGGGGGLVLAEAPVFAAADGVSISESEVKEDRDEVSPSLGGLPLLRLTPAFAGDFVAGGFLLGAGALLMGFGFAIGAIGIRWLAFNAMVLRFWAATDRGRFKELFAADVGTFIDSVVDMSITSRLLTSSYVGAAVAVRIEGSVMVAAAGVAPESAELKLDDSPFIRLRIISVAAENCGTYGDRLVE
jgi:hypothetical protein